MLSLMKQRFAFRRTLIGKMQNEGTLIEYQTKISCNGPEGVISLGRVNYFLCNKTKNNDAALMDFKICYIKKVIEINR